MTHRSGESYAVDERVDFEPRVLRKHEVPEHVWEFSLWLRRYTKRRRIADRLTAAQFEEVEAEATRRGLTIAEDPQGLSIDYVKQ